MRHDPAQLEDALPDDCRRQADEHQQRPAPDHREVLDLCAGLACGPALPDSRGKLGGAVLTGAWAHATCGGRSGARTESLPLWPGSTANGRTLKPASLHPTTP